MRPPQDWRTARATLAIGAVTTAAWVVATVLRLEPYAYQAAGFIPARHDALRRIRQAPRHLSRRSGRARRRPIRKPPIWAAMAIPPLGMFTA